MHNLLFDHGFALEHVVQHFNGMNSIHIRLLHIFMKWCGDKDFKQYNRTKKKERNSTKKRVKQIGRAHKHTWRQQKKIVVHSNNCIFLCVYGYGLYKAHVNICESKIEFYFIFCIVGCM